MLNEENCSKLSTIKMEIQMAKLNSFLVGLYLANMECSKISISQEMMDYIKEADYPEYEYKPETNHNMDRFLFKGKYLLITHMLIGEYDMCWVENELYILMVKWDHSKILQLDKKKVWENFKNDLMMPMPVEYKPMDSYYRSRFGMKGEV